MNDNTKSELMKTLGITDARVADDIIAYAQTLTAPKRKANDFALAKALNLRVTDIIDMVARAYKYNSFEATSIDIQALNKAYVLLVNELTKIYTRNEELNDITVTPTWKYTDIIEGNEWQISEDVYQNQSDAGQSHNAQINKLCIITGIEAPKYSPHIKQLVDDADEAITTYRTELKEEKRASVSSERKWFIPEYALTYGLDGTILVNGVLKLKKVHAGSAPDRLMEQATKQPNKIFKPELGQTARNLSTTLSSMGFSGTLRSLFFPSVSKDKGILFRPAVSNDTAKAERLDTTDLDLQLKELGANTQLNPIDIPF